MVCRTITWDAVRSGLVGAARTVADSLADTVYDKDSKVNWNEVIQNAISDALFSVLNNGVDYIGNGIKSSVRGNTAENATSGTILPTAVNNQYANVPNMGMLPYGSQYPVNTVNMNINNNGMSAVDNFKNNINVMPRVTDTKTTIAQPRNDVNNFTDNNVYNVPNLKTANSFAISDYVDKSLKNENSNMFMKIGEVSEKLKNDLSKIGLKAKRFVHAIRDNDIRHIEKVMA